MSNVVMFLIMVPVLIMTVRFWVGAARWFIKYKNTLGERVQRARSAFAEACREER